MFKKKNKYEDDEDYILDEEDEDLEDEDDEDENVPSDADDKDVIEPDIMPENPMALAYQINKESETIKSFKDLPKEVRFSFLDSTDKVEVKHHARAYRNWKYIEKIIRLRTLEDENKLEYYNKYKLVKCRDDFKQLLKDINKDHLIAVVEDLEDDELDKFIKQLKQIKPNYMLDLIEKNKEKNKMIYETYEYENTMPSYIDDMDNLGKVSDTTIISMGSGGKAAQHSIMSINAVKNENIEKQAQEKTRFSLLDSIKRRFG